MFAYIVRRLVLMLVTLFGISVIIFVLLRIVPGNIVDILFDAAGFVDQADKANLEKELGLDQPIVVQYLKWIGGLLHGDLGYSYVSEKPALQEILPRIPITARLAGLALLFSAAIGIPLGVISAVQPGHAARLCAAGRQPERPVAAVVLARPVDPDGVGLAVRNHADLQSEPEDMDRGLRDLLRSGDGGRLSQRRADDADHPLLDAGNTAAGLYPHRPRQGRVRAVRELSPCAEERGSSGHHHHRHRGGVPDRRPDRHRNRFQYPRRRPLPGRGDPLARLSDRAEPGDADRAWSWWSRTSPSTCSTPRSIHASAIRLD